MNELVTAAVGAAYNGLCLAAENGDQDHWRCQDVEAPMGNQFLVRTKVGKRLRVRITEVE